MSYEFELRKVDTVYTAKLARMDQLQAQRRRQLLEEYRRAVERIKSAQRVGEATRG